MLADQIVNRWVLKVPARSAAPETAQEAQRQTVKFLELDRQAGAPKAPTKQPKATLTHYIGNTGWRYQPDSRGAERTRDEEVERIEQVRRIFAEEEASREAEAELSRRLAIQNNGFSRTDGYRGHGAGALKPAGRRLNSA
ncbi:hypothetical protein CLAFUW4_03662 [Fulvia fulva]|uniref:Uncharacterized protein n=1 Tax=Passalora fulva TaxID=5499 RepID=A0A9Q8LA70_PASFU|nr:uncharacterized protein CLAFUR5_03640 [Fulvia fulva]KAK4631386.1 hypothetical protein CLAFUR4_03650 [Fulvia fulva]KAK4632648.1 hypothetical protein CLAFUR0_03653 [Fulvia fulva]UJO13632.1 hypothetical protein CLAFUR5_03640 [Fulvia fulva]WPV11384.1 hypothetical protein CLAFUW4_03662 [Fulvia fulva]WPV26089.1 hypothetical protein CLAFUW7_03654 [Fulvia fulva]